MVGRVQPLPVSQEPKVAWGHVDSPCDFRDIAVWLYQCGFTFFKCKHKNNFLLLLRVVKEYYSILLDATSKGDDDEKNFFDNP
jgi:hypothetical protein